MENDYEYRLNDPGDTTLAEIERKKRKKEEIIFISIIAVLSLICLIFIRLYFKKDKNNKIDNGNKELKN